MGSWRTSEPRNLKDGGLSKKMRYIKLLLLLVFVLALASCAPKTPACVNCHPTPGSQPAPTNDPCGLMTQGFVGPVATLFSMDIDGKTSQPFHWDPVNGIISSDDKSVEIKVPYGEQVTPQSWPEEFAFLKGTTFANCNGFLLLRLPAQVHVLEDQ